MAAYTTVQDLLDALSNALMVNDNIASFQIREGETINDPENWGYDLQLIEYKAIYSNETVRAFAFWVAVNSDGTVNWWSGKRNNISGGVPNPLKPVPATRDSYMTAAEYETAVDTEFPDWTPLKTKVDVQGEFDVVTVTAAHATEQHVITRKIRVWKDENGDTQWMIEEQ